jgi:DNA-binding GntR family transcriptional regulator
MQPETVLTTEIERRILEGTLSPGTRVFEKAVAEEFGVSRAAVRKAVRVLEHAGLVKLEANRGAIVRNLDIPEVMNIYDVWAGVSRAAGRLAALRATLKQVKTLENLHHSMLTVSKNENLERYHALNIEFHTFIFECSANPRLKLLHSQISKEMTLFSRRGVIGVGSLRVSTHEHSKIFEAIKDGDPERAAFEFESHVLNGKQRIVDTVVSGDSRSKT